jgi:uncharacterized membrane protein YkoI
MVQRAQKFVMAIAAVFALAVGSAVIANAASGGATTSTPTAQTQVAATDDTQGAGPGGSGSESALTGETADKVTAAAEDKVPGGTVLRVETDAGDAAYEAHVRKSDGTEVIVVVNKDFAVTAVQVGGRGGRGGPGGHDGRPCDRDGDGAPDSGSSGSGSGQNEGTASGGSGSSNQI